MIILVLSCNIKCDVSLPRVLCVSSDCEEPFVFSECGSVCEKHCDLLGQTDSCVSRQNCTPGCFCPEVSSHHTHIINVFESVHFLHYNVCVSGSRAAERLMCSAGSVRMCSSHASGFT